VAHGVKAIDHLLHYTTRMDATGISRVGGYRLYLYGHVGQLEDSGPMSPPPRNPNPGPGADVHHATVMKDTQRSHDDWALEHKRQQVLTLRDRRYRANAWVIACLIVVLIDPFGGAGRLLNAAADAVRRGKEAEKSAPTGRATPGPSGRRSRENRSPGGRSLRAPGAALPRTRARAMSRSSAPARLPRGARLREHPPFYPPMPQASRPVRPRRSTGPDHLPSILLLSQRSHADLVPAPSDHARADEGRDCFGHQAVVSWVAYQGGCCCTSENALSRTWNCR